MVRRGLAWLGQARLGKARQGLEYGVLGAVSAFMWRGKVRLGRVRSGLARGTVYLERFRIYVVGRATARWGEVW